MKKIVEATYSGLKFEDKVLETSEMGFDCFSRDVSMQDLLRTGMIILTNEEVHLTDGQSLACLWQRVVQSMGSGEEPLDLYEVCLGSPTGHEVPM